MFSDPIPKTFNRVLAIEEFGKAMNKCSWLIENQTSSQNPPMNIGGLGSRNKGESMRDELNESLIKEARRLARLIQSRDRALAQRKIAEDRFQRLFNELTEVGQAHAVAPRKFWQGENPKWRLWQTSKVNEREVTYTFKPVEPPQAPLNLDLGQKFSATHIRRKWLDFILSKIELTITRNTLPRVIEKLGVRICNH
jgi:hypothetical protein